MSRSIVWPIICVVAFAATPAWAFKPASKPAAKKAKLPTQAKVEEIVQAHFKKTRRKPGELISQSDVQPIFEQLAAAGWKVRDQSDILKLVPSDGDPLVKQLATPAGRQAMRGFGSQPGVYDRLDRMIALPNGSQFLRDILSWPDPGQMLETMTTTDKGADLADSLINAPRTKDFTRPTGRIYTPEAFSARLLKSYEAAKK